MSVPSLDPEALEQHTRRLLTEMWSGGRLELADAVVSPGYRGHFAQVDEARGPAGVKSLVSMYRTAFPDLHVEIDDLIVHGERVVTRWTATGTHRGELMGLAATQRHVEVSGITIDRWAHGFCIESWSESA